MKSFTKIVTQLVILASFLASSQASAQSGSHLGGYKQVKRLGGTSQSICRPAIRSADELQSFALNQRQDIIDILQSANWPGNADDVLAAIEAGQFSEESYPVGTKLEWMGMREKGQPIAREKRQWAGKQAFEGFELNIVSNCVQHQLLIPKACCNVSLVQSTPVGISAPAITLAHEGNNTIITVKYDGGGQVTQLTFPDGHQETLTLNNGSWTGILEPGHYTVEAINTTDCGESTPALHAFDIAPPPVAAIPAGGAFFAPFIGRQVRSIDPPLVGIQAGWLGAINDRTDWFVQGGGSYNLDVSELSVFIDLGIERKIGEGGFIGAGVGLWDINNSDDLPNSNSPKQDVSYFIHGGANTPWTFHNRPVQWFGEARIFDDFTDDISHHNILKLGLRYMY